MTDQSVISAVPIVCVYVDDFVEAQKFYEEIFGLSDPSSMGPEACYYQVTPDLGLYLEGGNKRIDVEQKNTRSSFVLRTSSASKLYERMSSMNVRLLHNQPSNMGGDNYWFMFADPSGNIIEIVGGP